MNTVHILYTITFIFVLKLLYKILMKLKYKYKSNLDFLK